MLTPGYVFTVDGERRLLGRDRVNVLSTRRASRDYNPTVLFDLNFWAAVLASTDAETFELEASNAWPGPNPGIELSAQPPTVSVMEAASTEGASDRPGFDDLDAELVELARKAEEAEAATGQIEEPENDN